jgi:DNA mismatch repair protein MutL
MRAYEKLIPENCTPSYFLYLAVEPDRVDVNVSPHKTEVRFADAEDVNQIISAAVRSTLAKSGSVGMMDFERPEVEIPVMGVDEGYVYAEPKTSTNLDYNPFVEDCGSIALPAIEDEPGDALPPMPTPSLRSSGSTPKWQSVQDFPMPEYVDITSSVNSKGVDLSAYVNDEPSHMELQPSVDLQQSIALNEQMAFTDVMPVGGGYALAQSAGRSMVVDLRRVKERLLYDNYMAMLSVGSCPSQQLLFAEELILSQDDYALLQAQEVEFAALGFELELQDECRVLVKGVPSNLASEQIDVMLYDMLREVEQQGDLGERVRESLALMMAQNSSRKVVAQSRDQVQDMLQRLCECDNYTFSPSGKPIMAELTVDELRKKLN